MALRDPIPGNSGVILVDPLSSGPPDSRPVTGVIHTHASGGFTGGDVPIPAPVGFMEQAVATTTPPTADITHTGQEITIDGVRFVFQLAPASEVSFFIPSRAALFLARNTGHSRAWARYLHETLTLFGQSAEV